MLGAPGAPSTMDPDSSGGLTSGPSTYCPSSPPSRGVAVEPMLTKRTRSPWRPVTWDWVMLRPRASTSVVHSMMSVWPAVATYCVVSHRQGRLVAASMAATETAMAAPP